MKAEQIIEILEVRKRELEAMIKWGIDHGYNCTEQNIHLQEIEELERRIRSASESLNSPLRIQQG